MRVSKLDKFMYALLYVMGSWQFITRSKRDVLPAEWVAQSPCNITRGAGDTLPLYRNWFYVCLYFYWCMLNRLIRVIFS